MRAAGLIALGLLGCATTAAPPSALESARKGIAEGGRIISAAMLIGNAERVATVFTDDATYLPLRQPGFVQGRQALIEYFRARFASTRFLEVELVTTSLDVSGDMAYEIGTNRLRTQSGGAAPVTVTGRYLTVWRRGADTVWRIQADCPIPDPPRPEPAKSSERPGGTPGGSPPG
ncbi:MAG TPA: nuclear transport factor 2 family protein [Myxococcaceae bacterium]|nr:nuclear transport factor 2 family protein [Myxococcaceae bacterium]